MSTRTTKTTNLVTLKVVKNFHLSPLFEPVDSVKIRLQNVDFNSNTILPEKYQ